MNLKSLQIKDKKFANDIDLADIADDTAGFTGAELSNILNEAAIIATVNDHEAIQKDDLEEAIKKVTVGLQKTSRLISEKDKKLTAYHEAGHAIVSKFLPTVTDVKEISIIPRGVAGGYTMYKSDEDKYYVSKTEMEEKLMQSIQSEEIEMRKIFISFHYAEGRAIAKRIRNVLRDKDNYVVNDEETIQQKNSDIIKDWINEKLQGTDTTVLVWTDNIFKSEFVHYEIAKSIERHNAFVILTAASDWCGSCIISQLREKKWIPETVPDDYFVVGEWNNMEKSLIPLLDMAFAKKRLSN